MPAPVRTEASTAASCVSSARNHSTDAHTLRMVSEPRCPIRHNARTQRSFPLFRVLHSRSSKNPAVPMDRDSQRVDTQQAPSDAQPVITGAEHSAFLFAQPVKPSSSRRQLWSAANVELLRAEYPTLKLVRDISAELGRSVGAVYGKARRLNLKRQRRGGAAVEGGLLPPAPSPGAMPEFG